MTSSNFNWQTGLFLIAYHLFLIIALPIYFFHYPPPWAILALSFILVYVTGTSITSCYHRLYSHQTYKINPVVEGVLLFFATMATQGSAIRWSYEHRCHHAFLDTDRDPYSIKKGFWYAHFLWMFEKPKEIEPNIVADLMRRPLLRFQHRYYPVLMLLTNAILVLFVGWCFNDYLAAFLFAWVTRLFFLHHFTWFINSLAHTWGQHTFCQEISAVDNYIISLVTFGEGYHNYHHKFAYDYRNGIRWYHFDPTKWLIWTLNKCGLAYQLKKVDSYQILEKLLLDRKRLILEKIQNSLLTQKDEWEKKITDLIDGVLAKSKQVRELKEHYFELKKKKEGKKDHLAVMKAQIKDLKKSLREEYRNWLAIAQKAKRINSYEWPGEKKPV